MPLQLKNYINVPITFNLSVCPSVCPDVKAKEPLNGLLSNVILGSSTKSYVVD
jgi:hypothetical protein